MPNDTIKVQYNNVKICSFLLTSGIEKDPTTGVFSFAFVNVLELQSERCTAFIPTTVLHTAHLLRPLSNSYARPYYSIPSIYNSKCSAG